MEKIEGPDASRCTYRLTWSVEDDEFVATCARVPLAVLARGLPNCRPAGTRRRRRRHSRRPRIAGRGCPRPLSERRYSGEFNLRVGEGLHRRLAIEAAEERLGLNQYVIRRLSETS